ncbi:TPA: hypothetical protein N0H24_006107 [Pseudomonas aeruginosa]|nr:hypothetical protein [Pseudomonas aeruginosa]
MANKHTPGPWKVGTPGPNGCYTVGTQGGLMTAMIAHSICEPDQIETANANARLMAAAPEMLGALQHIEEYWNRDSNEQAMTDALWHIIETAQAAIAKATA